MEDKDSGQVVSSVDCYFMCQASLDVAALMILVV